MACEVTTTAAPPSDIWAGVPGCDRAVLREGRLEVGETFDCRLGPDALVAVNRNRVTASLRDRHADDLLPHQTVFHGVGRSFVRHRREGVLAGATDDVAVVLVGRQAHRDVVERAGQRIQEHGVDEHAVPVAVAGTGVLQQVGSPGHGLHPARDDNVSIARGDHLVRQVDRVEAGQAELVDDDRRRGERDPRFRSGLACR